MTHHISSPRAVQMNWIMQFDWSLEWPRFFYLDRSRALTSFQVAFSMLEKIINCYWLSLFCQDAEILFLIILFFLFFLYFDWLRFGPHVNKETNVANISTSGPNKLCIIAYNWSTNNKLIIVFRDHVVTEARNNVSMECRFSKHKIKQDCDKKFKVHSFVAAVPSKSLTPYF